MGEEVKEMRTTEVEIRDGDGTMSEPERESLPPAGLCTTPPVRGGGMSQQSTGADSAPQAQSFESNRHPWQGVAR